MAILDAEKLFVDTGDDITSVIEKVVNIKGETLILVIPQNSPLFTSVLTLKILYRRSLEAGKDIIIVTEDNYGGKISQRAGFIYVSKVSQITSDLWEVVKDKNLHLRADLQKGIKQKHEEEQEEKDLQHHIEYEKAEIEHAVHEILVEEDEEFLEEEEKLKEEHEAEAEEFVQKKDIEEIEEPVKVIKFKGIAIVPGGDVALSTREGEDDKMMDKLVKNSESMEGRSMTGGSFTGRDFTRVRVEKGFFERITDKFKPPTKPEDRFEENELSSKKNLKTRKKAMIIGGIVAFFLLITGYLVMFSWSSVFISVTFSKQEVLADETVRLNFDTEYVFDENVPDVIPAREAKSELTSTSGTAQANGKSQSGVKSTGQIYIINDETEEIILQPGTLLTDTVSSLDFVIKQQVTLPAADLADDNTIDPTTTSNVGIEAATFGEEFNLENPQFVINGHEDLVVGVDQELTGGIAEEVTVVSQENVDALIAQLTPTIEQNAINDLKSRIPNGYTLIEESIEISEPKITANPDVGEKPDAQGNFDLTIELEATGIIIKEEDLIAAIEAGIVGTDSEQVAINSLNDLTISQLTDIGEDTFITVGAKGDVTNQLSEEEIKELVKGKSLSQANDALDRIEDITSFELEYTPVLTPSFLRFVPNNVDRITVDIEE